MNGQNSSRGIKMAVVALLAVMTLQARAAFTLQIAQIGNDVVATGVGSLNTAALVFYQNNADNAVIYPANLTLLVGAVNNPSVSTFAFSAPIPNFFGNGRPIFADSGSGDSVGVFQDSYLAVPLGYISGSPLSNSSTWLNQTFSTLGLTPGTYTYSWGSGVTADSFTMNISTNPVPEPSTMAMATIGGIAGFVLVRRKR